MTSWKLEFLDEALRDLKKIDGSLRPQVLNAIKKVQSNPLPTNQGGYGHPLGNKSATNLTDLLKIKLRSSGIRIVYKIEERNDIMVVVIRGTRSDDEVYRQALRRREKHGL